MKIFTVIGGVNGVGKSSLSGVLSSRSNDLGSIIDTDKLNAKYGGDRIKGGKEAVRLLDRCFEEGVDLTWETTLSGTRPLKTIKRAKELGYYIRLFYIGVDTADESIRRIANRVKKGGHSIDDEDVIRRFGKRFDDLCRVLPYCSEAVLYDNENGFVEVAEYRNGKIIKTADSVPAWLTELEHALDLAP